MLKLRDNLIAIASVIIVLIIALTTVAFLNPNDGKNYSLGMKEGHAYYCNLPYNVRSDLFGKADYESGKLEGARRAKKSNCLVGPE